MPAGAATDDGTATRRRSAIFRTLGPEPQRVLAYASALGHELDFALLAQAMDADEEVLAEQVERLIRLGVLRERPGGDRFVFALDEERAGAYQALSPSRLRVIHR